MTSISVEFPTDWHDYELIDSGSGEKLERFGPPTGGYVMARPDPRAIWQKTNPDAWFHADATFTRTDAKAGSWNIKKSPPNPWLISYNDITFTLRPTEFKHVGVFPEQAVNWNWLQKIINGKPLKVLNLFAYTGGATMASALAGAHVTHVDAAKSAIDWAHENVRVSKLEDKPIRWIEEDAMKFITREARRGSFYDGIILDPPRFGRGSKGEVWKLEDDLPRLIAAVRTILTPHPSFILVNAYTADLSSIALGNMLQTDNFGELALEDKNKRLLPNGIFARLTFEQRQ